MARARVFVGCNGSGMNTLEWLRAGREHTQTKGGHSLLDGAISHSKNADLLSFPEGFQARANVYHMNS